MTHEPVLPPEPPSSAVRARLRRQRVRDTAPEMAVRRLLHARGLRYRVDARPLPQLRSKADIVFTRVRLAVFIDGCFWHRCPEHYTRPKNNAKWWDDKISGNVTRDGLADAALIDGGWQVLRFWEHEAPAVVAQRIEQAHSQRRTS